MTDDNYYLKQDLEDYANLGDISRDEEYWRPSRTSLLEDALGVEVHTVSSGGYQGTMTFTFVKAGYLWVVKDSYGSCSYCDGLLSAKQNDRPSDDCENVRQYAQSMMRNAYAFDSKNDAVRFLNEAADFDSVVGGGGWSWSEVVDETIENINEANY